MQETIEKLQLQCKTYEKQNEDLRSEISQASRELQDNNKNSLKTENQSLKNKLAMHENMLLRILSIAEDLCEEEPSICSKIFSIDFHTYNYIISKLEIAKSRMSRNTTKIQQLEYEKKSISEMLNCYITTEKIIDTHKNKYSCSESTTPDYPQSGLSRKSSVLMETSANTFVHRYDEENYYKRPLSSASEANENQEPFIVKNNTTNLKGISNIANAPQKHKNGHSFSVSPLIPKPKKVQKIASTKQNYKSNTLKISKPQDDKKKGCKMY